MSETHLHVQPWLFPLATTFVLAATAFVYLYGWIRLRAVSRSLAPVWRIAAFVCGLFAVWIVVASPLSTGDHRSLTIHMVKHLLLMTVAAPLVLAGAPFVVLVRGISERFIQYERLIASRPVRWLGQSRTHLVLCWLAGTTAVIGWHLPVAFELGMRSHWAHSVEDVCFLCAGLFFWWPVAEAWSSATGGPRWSIALYLFLAVLPCDVLSAFLVFGNRLVYPSYLSASHLFNLSPLQDQECAGALMWVWVTFAYLIPAVVITMQSLSPSNRCSPNPTHAAWVRLAARSSNDEEPEVV